MMSVCRAAVRTAVRSTRSRSWGFFEAGGAYAGNWAAVPACSRRPWQQCRHLSFSYPGPRKLSEITNLPLLEKEEPAIVSDIWRQFHDARKDAIGATLSGAELQELLKRAKESPMFIFPVHRGADGGYFMLLCQFQGSHFLLTFLDDYRTNPSGAQPYMSVSLFSDLAESKGVGLVRADVTAQLSRAEGVRVLDLMQRYYIGSEELYGMVRAFNHAPAEFNFEVYMSTVPAPDAPPAQ
ncbi:ATP11 protein-domain-containing protein, partial [Tribonema minus]